MRRREFLTLMAAAPALRAAESKKKKIAALSSTYHVRSHSDNIITRFLEGYWINQRCYDPPFQVASLWMDQIHPADVGQKLALAYGFPVAKSIREALTLGTGKLAVDGVLLVCEHGNYPHNEKNQQLYPRYEFYEQVVQVFEESGRSCPVFVDKQLSYDWKKARRMYDWSIERKFPLMAGSSVSVTFRRPELDYPLGVDLESAVAVGYGWIEDGGLFHILEALQAFVERRKGGEVGVRAVQMLKGEAVWRAANQGLWRTDLLEAALSRSDGVKRDPLKRAKNPVVCLIEYIDGFRAAAVALDAIMDNYEYLVALKVKGRDKPDRTRCYIPVENSNNFSPLVHAIAHMFETGARLYPVERTLLTTGTLSALMESDFRGGRRTETPELKISYKAPRKSYYAPGSGS